MYIKTYIQRELFRMFVNNMVKLSSDCLLAPGHFAGFLLRTAPFQPIILNQLLFL